VAATLLSISACEGGIGASGLSPGSKPSMMPVGVLKSQAARRLIASATRGSAARAARAGSAPGADALAKASSRYGDRTSASSSWLMA